MISSRMKLGAFLAFTVACGTSSPAGGLPDAGDAGSDAGQDAGSDAGQDGGLDGGIDAGLDGGTDAGLDAGPDGGDAGQDAGTDAGPIIAPDDTWTWVDFAESKCGSGTTTGIGVNPHAGSTNLVFYFEGGGDCTTAASCWGSDAGAKSMAGFDATDFAHAAQLDLPILDRSLASNPFAAMNLVYIPYCTGDLHFGTALQDLPIGDGGVIPTYFWGGNDLDIFLSRVAPSFPGTTHVWLTGTSAGGFGTYLSFDKVQRAFGVRVDILDDSGPAITAASSSDNQGIFTLWGFVAPAGCSAPCQSLRDILNYDLGVQASWSPPGRYGFLTFAQDITISKDFGYTLDAYAAEMVTYSASLPAAPAAATYIEYEEQAHVVESVPALEPDYLPWINEMVSDSPDWSDWVRDAGM